jgi:hypothetical protein
MSTRYTVAKGHEFSYPADANSEMLIRKAGGVSQLSKSAREQIKFKTVSEGEDCSDMPKSSLEIFKARGWVLEDRRENERVPEKEVTEKEEKNG